VLGADCHVIGTTNWVRRSVKVTGLAQKLGLLEAAHRDSQSKSRANLQLLGQPCSFRARPTRERRSR
jgi:hypothetical protein